MSKSYGKLLNRYIDLYLFYVTLTFITLWRLMKHELVSGESNLLNAKLKMSPKHQKVTNS